MFAKKYFLVLSIVVLFQIHIVHAMQQNSALEAVLATGGNSGNCLFLCNLF
jgi:hypothetical protein